MTVSVEVENDGCVLIGMDCWRILRTMPEPDDVVTIGVVGPDVVSQVKLSVVGEAT